MPATALVSPVRMRRARGPVVWLLVLALAVYGCSSVLVQLLGPTHRHALSVSAEPPWLQRAAQALRAVQTWRAELHARWLPGAPAGLADAAVLAHAHAHATFQRHHHDPHDLTVVSLDGGEAAAAAEAASSGSGGSATLPLGPAMSWWLPGPSALPACWPKPAAARWTDATPWPLEHPPRG